MQNEILANQGIRCHNGYEVRYTGRGYPYYAKKKIMPRIYDNFLNSVFYLYQSEQDAKDCTEYPAEEGGTGFFVSVKSKTIPGFIHAYAVTNIHCLPAHDDPGSRWMRLNLKLGGFDTLEIRNDEWVRHPLGSDVAVYYLTMSQELFIKYDTKLVSEDHFISEEIISGPLNIGIGDEVFMVGRFTKHGGRKRNLPSARFGNISMMPIETILHKKLGPQESFLVEMRSHGGYSGSPVFVHLLPNTVRPNAEATELQMVSRGDWWLLGIDWGHIHTWQNVLNADMQTQYYDGTGIMLNSGVAGVVPAWKLRELLDLDELVEERRKDDERTLAEMKQSPMVLDSAFSVPAEPTPFQKFAEGLRLGLSAPKEEVKKSMEEEERKSE